MINIAIVDDDIFFTDMIKKRLVSSNKNLNVYCYNNPFDFISNVNNIDYVLLDIELPEIDGISLSKQLRKNEISIFFITIHKELMVKAFGRNVEGFISKDNLEEGISNLLVYIDQKIENKYLVLNIDHIKFNIDFDEILYINYSLRDVEIFLTNNAKVIQKNTNLKDIFEKLDENFVLINRNTIVNVKYVHSLKNGYVFVRKRKLKVSRRKIKNMEIHFFERKLKSGY